MQKAHSFAVGDLVQLKSGGPAMCVDRLDEKIGCTWFQDGELKSSEFLPECLTIPGVLSSGMVRIKVWKGGVE